MGPVLLRSSLRRSAALAAVMLAAVLPGCSDDDESALDPAAIDAIEDTDDLLRAVAIDGVTGEAASTAAVRAADDVAALVTASTDFVDLVPRFVAEVLEADQETLTVLVGAGIDGLLQATGEAASDLSTLNEANATDQATQRLFLGGAAIDVAVYFERLAAGADQGGVDRGARWVTLVAVLEQAETGAIDAASFDGLATDGDLAVPENPPDLVAAVGPRIERLLAEAIHSEAAARTLLVGDVSLEAFAADPLVASVIDADTGDLGRRVIDAFVALVIE